MHLNRAVDIVEIVLLGLIVIFGSAVYGVPLNIESPKRDFANNSLAEPVNSLHRSECRYKATTYASGDNVPTDESCLFCHCKGSVVICKLRICPDVPDPPPPGCIVVQKANKCCSQLVCHDNHIRKLSREQRLPSANETLPPTAIETLDKDKGNYCVHDGTVYAEGSAMRSSTLCQHCFCIRGEMKCSKPQCVIPMNGCKPRFRSYACCPTNYDCNQSNASAILKTVPTSTPIPQFLKGCKVDGRFVAEGEPVLPMQLASGHGNNTNICQTCFCMGGVVHCRPLQCDRPIEGCRPVIEDGHCCPDRYECDKQIQKEIPKETTTSTTTTTPKAVSTPTSGIPTSRQNSQNIPLGYIKQQLLRARKDDEGEWTTVLPVIHQEPSTLTPNVVTTTVKQVPLKKARISYTSVAGFKNRSETGSREQRRNKDRLEYAQRSFYEDDAHEDTSLSLENSGQSDEQSSSVFFDEQSDHSTSNSDVDDSRNSDTESTTITELLTETSKDESVTENINDQETSSKPNEIILSDTEKTAIDIIDETESTTQLVDSHNTPEATEVLISKESIPHETLKSQQDAISSQPKNTPSITTTSSPGETTTIANANLEFISFGVEDAVVSPMNETRYEIYPGKATSLPSYDVVARQGSLLPAIPPHVEYTALKPLKLQVPEGQIDNNSSTVENPVPIIVEKDLIMDVPVQTSLYNNGYYNHGIFVDDLGKDDELVITQAEIGESSTPKSTPGFHGHVYNEGVDSGNVGFGEVLPETIPPSLKRTTTTTVKSTTPITLGSKKPEQPLTAISSNQKFIPSFSPVMIIPENETANNPSRTYSKFGVQDSSYFRYGYPGSGFVPSLPTETDHHRYYNPADAVPSSQVDQMNRKVPVNKDSRLRYNPYVPYDDPLVYDEDGSEEFGSYESYLIPQTTITPLRNRYGVPDANSRRPVSPVSFNPVPLISSGVSSVINSNNKDKTTKKPGMGTKIINSKPLRRPKPVEDQRLDSSSDPLGFKPVVAFPFAIPKSQNNFNMGLKLSGCNIYGKMYGVGQVIHELSSICVQCQCTEVGVQCSELQC